MFSKLCLLPVLLALATAEVEKRQTPTCTNAFQLSSNPCASGGGRTYYPVPNDNTKFIQCDIFGGAYVVQCPSGLIYNQATNSCQKPQTQPIYNPTAAPTNPCTAQAINAGQIYFIYPGDAQKFYECTAVGSVIVLQCPNNLVWDQARVSCVLPQGTIAPRPIIASTTITATRPTPGVTVQQPLTQSVQNPCTAQQLASNNLYFAHPDPTKFIQCDLAGNAYEMNCPSGLIWNQYLEVCASAFNTASIGRR